VAGIDKPLHAKHKRFRPEARDSHEAPSTGPALLPAAEHRRSMPSSA